jgi:ABC-type transport system involved in multi-copper enzyme maturation permease subunit
MTAAIHTINPTASAPRTAMTRALAGEWTKLVTLPSNWRTATVTVITAVGVGALAVLLQANQYHGLPAQQKSAFDPTSTSLSSMIVTTVILGALAARSVTAEYSTGMIRSSFTAMPARTAVLVAKAATVAAFVFPVALVGNLASFVIGQQILATKHLQVGITHPGALLAIMLGTAAVSLTAVIGVGLGGLIRHTAGAATTLAVVILGGLTIGQFVPAGLRQYLPGTAMQASVTVHRSTGLLAPGSAIIVLAAYAAIALTAASMRAAHRDA